MDDGSILPYLTIAALFVVAAYFAVSETAYASVSRVRLRTLADKGDRGAVRALRIVDRFDRTITAILIGTNVTHIAVSSYAAVLALRKWGTAGVAATTVAVTLAVFFAGEMLPKSIAKKYSERLAISLAPSLSAVIFVLSPITILLSKIGVWATKLAGSDPEITVTEDELIDIVETMTEDGEISEDRGELLGAALAFSDVTAEHILTARVDITALDSRLSPEEIIKAIKKSKHSRLPVYRESIDNIVGVLQIRKYIKAWLRAPGRVNLESLLDEPIFKHRSCKANELLTELSDKKANIAIITDSYGGTVGLVTIEDILEELVGEIWDEDDEIKVPFVELQNGVFELDAEIAVEDALENMGCAGGDTDEFEHKLLGDWVYEQFDHIPIVGDSFTYGNVTITVAQKSGNRVMKLRAEIVSPKDQEAKT